MEGIHGQYIGRVEETEVKDYFVEENGRFVIFSSASLEGGSDMEHEKAYLKEFRRVINAADRWMKKNPDVKIKSVAISERGGAIDYPSNDAYYTVRVVLWKE